MLNSHLDKLTENYIEKITSKVITDTSSLHSITTVDLSLKPTNVDKESHTTVGEEIEMETDHTSSSVFPDEKQQEIDDLKNQLNEKKSTFFKK